jgi:hypothetical protein
MSKVEKEFKITEESILLTPLEWGLIYSLTFIVIEYFLVDHLSEWAIEAFYNLNWIFSIIYLILAVKEARDKKNNGTIGFWKGVFIAISTGLVITIVNIVWSLLIYPIDPSYTIDEIVIMKFVYEMGIFIVLSLIIGIAMKRH